jgi:crotonobetainyl-CoA:carnitine CoA-transferase CaiB-like acyl-CoA transferase
MKGGSKVPNLFALALEPVSRSAGAASAERKGALADLRVLDLTQMLADPSGTQMLTNPGAEVITMVLAGAGWETLEYGKKQDGKN